MELVLPAGFSGRLNVEITAVAAGASRQRNLVIIVQSVTTPVATTGMSPATTPDDGGRQCNTCIACSLGMGTIRALQE